MDSLKKGMIKTGPFHQAVARAGLHELRHCWHPLAQSTLFQRNIFFFSIFLVNVLCVNKKKFTKIIFKPASSSFFACKSEACLSYSESVWFDCLFS
jgi:hypothetical protein